MNKKETIIQSALALFAKHGYTETSIDKIAQHAKVSKGLTYTHFKNKEELLHVVIEHSITRMTDEMMGANEMDIQGVLGNFFTSLRQHKEVIRLCLLLVIHPETPKTVNQQIEGQKQSLLAALTSLLEDKYKSQSSQEAMILLATLDGITLDYVTHPDDKSLDAQQNYLLSKYT